MSSDVRDRMLPVFAKMRAIADTRFGLRRYRVFLRTETYSDNRGGRGSTRILVDTELTEKPRVREAGAQDIAASGGKVNAGDMILDRITPLNDAETVGIAPGTIPAEPDSSPQKVLVVLAGPGMPDYVDATSTTQPSGGGEFTVVAAKEFANFGFEYTLRPRTGHR